MPDLGFEVESAGATPNAAVPQLTFKVRLTNSEAQPIQSIALRAQVQIEPARRFYSTKEREHLKELFGEAEQWSKSLQPLLWTNVNVAVGGFEGGTTVELPVPCTFDFNVAVTKYIHGLEDGELPIALLFSGTVFYAAAKGLQIQQIPWDKQANYRLPISVWKEMMDRYYPNVAWICLQRDVFERLYEFKSRHGLHTWEQALERMLEMSAEVKR
jgi:uncharacterized protein DUF6084